ncbi:unnamed protein product [Closterium sp. Yama58-4]|nr:unnamed protein product [Closterium sp. Yama58-4]
MVEFIRFIRCTVKVFLVVSRIPRQSDTPQHHQHRPAQPRHSPCTLPSFQPPFSCSTTVLGATSASRCNRTSSTASAGDCHSRFFSNLVPAAALVRTAAAMAFAAISKPVTQTISASATGGSRSHSLMARTGSTQSSNTHRWRCEASTSGSPKPEITENENQERNANPAASNGSAASGSDKPKLIAYDYGFQSKFLRTGPNVPGNVFKLAFENFAREYAALRSNVLYEELSDVRTDNIKRDGRQLALAYAGRFLVSTLKFFDKLLTLYDGLPEIKPPPAMPEESEALRKKLQQLTLSNEAVAQREKDRPQVEAPGWILLPYKLLCWMLDVIFYNRPIQRFWFLETVARMPYFSYISMLHLYETLGWWRVGAEVRKVHFAEEWNEMNHLKIMESLGGDRLWIDRFFAQHAAILYYWVLNFMFLVSPRVAYNFSELIEAHAVDTYGEFVDENAELLKTLPPSPAAIAYYNSDDLYMFDEFQTSRVPESRRPKIESLYDVFCAIRDDEMEHVKTMSACQQLDSVVRSPNRPGYAPLPSPADVYFEGLVAKTSSSTSASSAPKATSASAAASAFSAAVGEAKLPKDVLPQALKSQGDGAIVESAVGHLVTRHFRKRGSRDCRGRHRRAGIKPHGGGECQPRLLGPSGKAPSAGAGPEATGNQTATAAEGRAAAAAERRAAGAAAEGRAAAAAERKAAGAAERRAAAAAKRRSAAAAEWRAAGAAEPRAARAAEWRAAAAAEWRAAGAAEWRAGGAAERRAARPTGGVGCGDRGRGIHRRAGIKPHGG